MTFPSVPQHSALAYTFCHNSRFSSGPFGGKGELPVHKMKLLIVGGMQITLLNVEIDFLSTSIYHPRAQECCGFIAMSLVL